MNLKFKKSWLPNILAIILFAVIAIVYFYPTLEGFSLKQGDITNFKGMSKEILDFRKYYDSEPLWTNTMFGGMPAYQISTTYISGYRYLQDLLNLPFSRYAFLLFLAFTSFYYLLKTVKTDKYLSFLGALTYGLSTYNLLIIEAGHMSKMQTLAIVPLTLALLLRVYQNNKNINIYTFLFALLFGYQLYSNHIQMTYYFAFLFAGVVIHFGFKSYTSNLFKSFINRSLILGVACILALLANFGNLYNTKNFAKHTMRGDAIINIDKGNSDSKNITKSGLKKDYITQWSYGIGETYNLLVPNAKGNSRHLTGEFLETLKENSPQDYNKAVQFYQQSRGQLFKGYWGNQPFTSGPNYIGAILVFLALLYIFLVKGSLKWSILIPTILALVLAWGKNLMWFTDLFIDYFPLYNKFRTVSSFLVVLNLTVPLMAILFLNKLISDKEWREKNYKHILQVGGGLAGLILVIGFVPFGFDFLSERETAMVSSLNNAELEGLMDQLVYFRKSVFRSDSLTVFIQVIISLVLILGFIKTKIKANWLVIILGAITVVNLWMVDKQYMNNEKVKGKYLSWEKQTPLNHSIQATQGDLDIFNKEKTPQILSEIESKTKSFRKDHGRRMTKQDKESITFSALGFNTNYRVLNLSNPFNSAIVSYFHKSSGGYNPAKLRRYQDMIDFYISKEISLVSAEPEKMNALNMLNTKYYLQGGKLVLENPYAYGNAWFVETIKEVTTNNDEILEFKNINPAVTAIIHTEFKDAITSSNYTTTGNTISLTDYKPNKLTYNATCANKGLAVFSEVYYEDGWNAYIDGKQVDYVRANYILRALEVPKGKHTIEFKFEPKMYSLSNILNSIGFGIILLGIIFFAVKKKD